MSVYRSTNALNKLFGLTQAHEGLLNEPSASASYYFLTGLGQDVKPVGYSTRLQFADPRPSDLHLPTFDNIDVYLTEALQDINTLTCKLIENKRKKTSNLPVIITHNFTKAEIDISAKSPLITAILEEAFSGELGHNYRSLAWNTFTLLKSSSDESGAMYIYNSEYSSVTALCNDTSLQLHIEEKPGKPR